MLKNIPNKFKQAQILDLLDSTIEKKYDYFYMPIDLKTSCNYGYAFINLIHPLYVVALYKEF